MFAGNKEFVIALDEGTTNAKGKRQRSTVLTLIYW